MSEDTAIRLIEAIDIDHSGDVDEHEFVAWMELNTSQLKTAMIVAKILLGLGQIMSKQPVKEHLLVRARRGAQKPRALMRLTYAQLHRLTFPFHDTAPQ